MESALEKLVCGELTPDQIKNNEMLNEHLVVKYFVHYLHIAETEKSKHNLFLMVSFIMDACDGDVSETIMSKVRPFIGRIKEVGEDIRKLHDLGEHGFGEDDAECESVEKVILKYELIKSLKTLKPSIIFDYTEFNEWLVKNKPC